MRRRRSHGNPVYWNLRPNSRPSVNVPYITYEDTKEIDLLEELGVDGKIILKLCLIKYCGRLCSGQW
jgi:hypothetical protein